MPRELNYLTVDKECQAIKREREAVRHVLIGQQHLHPFSLQNMDEEKADNSSTFSATAGHIHCDQSDNSVCVKRLYLSKSGRR